MPSAATSAKRRPAKVKTPPKALAPTRAAEHELWERGFDTVVGIDEVGRGAWAGPLVIGAAVLPRSGRVLGVRDSKMLSESEREKLFSRIAGWCQAWAVGAASQEECDTLGMSAAQKLATLRALQALPMDEPPSAAIVDGTWDFVSPHVAHVQRKVKADAYCLSVAAASILAKVSRDRMMRAHAEHYPNWHFDTNKGYPCPLHKTALLGYGPSAIHRRSWVFMDNYVPWPGMRTVAPEQPTLF
jgi:ribonuclease HII